jgi:hypothetical protein
LDAKSSELAKLIQDNEQKSNEIATLRSRSNLSQQNWLKEKEELMAQQSYLQSEFEQAKEAMHNWEILAMEERSIREGLGEKVIDLEEQLIALKDSYEKVASERDSQTATVDGLQRALQEIQAGKAYLLVYIHLWLISILTISSSEARTPRARGKLNHSA